MEKLLFHICCAPCGVYLVNNFSKNYKLTLFFYNPNIWPKDEYKKRLVEVKKISQKEKIELIEGEYDDKNWFKLTKKYKNEKEGGKRCDVCFRMRLEETAKLAKKLKIENFSTSLAISPFKNLSVIKKIGEELAQEFKINFVIFSTEEKSTLWHHSQEDAQKENFYYQKYCGCFYSLSLLKYLKICYNKNNMNDNKWDNIIFLIEEKFGIDKRYKEKIEVAQHADGTPIFGEKECIEFNGAGGQMKIERIEKPKVIDKKVLSTKRVGGKVAVDYIYGDEMSYQVLLYKLDNSGQWQPVDLSTLA